MQAQDGQLSSSPSYSLEACKVHRLANSYGFPQSYASKCPCCQKFQNKESLDLNFSLVKIYYTGSQLPCFFTIVKHLGLSLLIISLVFALPLTLINKSSGACLSVIDCGGSFLLSLSVFDSFNSCPNINDISYLSLFVWTITTLMLLVLRKSVREIDTEIQQTDLFPHPFCTLCQLGDDSIPIRCVAKQLENWWHLEVVAKKGKSSQQFADLQSKEMEIEADRNWGKKEKRQNIKDKVGSKFIEKIISLKRLQPSQLKQPLTAIDMKEIQFAQSRGQPRVELLEKEQIRSTSQQVINRVFYLLVFKRKSLAKYFYLKNNPSLLQSILCFQNFRSFTICNKSVKVRHQLFPTQIYWENHELTLKYRLLKKILPIVFLLLSLSISSGLLYSITYVLDRVILDGDNDQDDLPFISAYFSLLAAFLINIVILIFTKLLSRQSYRQGHPTYYSQKSTLLLEILFQNILAMFIIPFMIFKSMRRQQLWIQQGFTSTFNMTILVYMVISILQKYLSPSSLASFTAFKTMDGSQGYSQLDANEKYTKPKPQICQSYASVLTVVLLTFCVMPFSPFMVFLSVLWFFVFYWLERMNVAYLYGQDQFHGSAFSRFILSVCQYFPFALIFGNLTVECVAFDYFSKDNFPTQIVTVNSIIFLLTLFNLILPSEKISKKIFKCRNISGQQISDSSAYSMKKDKFLMQFQQYKRSQLIVANEIEVKGDSERAARQMSQIERSLTLSLKEQLMNNHGAILTMKGSHFQEQSQPSDDIRDGYFEYEKKVEMSKPTHKVIVPPLFNKVPRQSNINLSLKKKTFDMAIEEDQPIRKVSTF